MLCSFSERLTRLGYQVTPVDGARAQLAASGTLPQSAVIFVGLPDFCGLTLLERLRCDCVECVVVTERGDYRTAVRAMRLGAFDCLEAPVDENELLAAVVHATAKSANGKASTLHGDAEAHSLRRWATLVVRMLDSPADPRTIKEWGRTIGTSSGALRNWCRTAQLSARRSLLLGRVLRAIAHKGDSTPPEHLLDIVDRRTLAKVFLLAGGDGNSLPETLEDCLQRQRLINDTRAIAEVRAEMSRRRVYQWADS